jgi:hypothetical protein
VQVEHCPQDDVPSLSMAPGLLELGLCLGCLLPASSSTARLNFSRPHAPPFPMGPPNSHQVLTCQAPQPPDFPTPMAIQLLRVELSTSAAGSKPVLFTIVALKFSANLVA